MKALKPKSLVAHSHSLAVGLATYYARSSWQGKAGVALVEVWRRVHWQRIILRAELCKTSCLRSASISAHSLTSCAIRFGNRGLAIISESLRRSMARTGLDLDEISRAHCREIALKLTYTAPIHCLVGERSGSGEKQGAGPT